MSSEQWTLHQGGLTFTLGQDVTQITLYNIFLLITCSILAKNLTAVMRSEISEITCKVRPGYCTYGVLFL